jgi:hypothetical protein
MRNIGIFIIAIIFTGCLTSSYRVSSDIYAVKSEIFKGNKLHVIGKDKTEYLLYHADLNEKMIKGFGQIRLYGEKIWSNFSGTIHLDSIDALVVTEENFAKSIAFYGGSAFLLVAISRAQSGPDQPELEIYQPWSGTGSCPFIYSWDGSRYLLEAEAIGSALGKSLEYESGHILPALVGDNKQIKIKISNERSEIHYLNSIKLLAMKKDARYDICMDVKNQVYPVYHPESPVKATGLNGTSCIEEISRHDGCYWHSPGILHLNNTLYDSLYVHFKKPAGATSGLIVINGINTRFSEMVFKNIFDVTGDQYLSFVQAIDRDPEMIALLKEWREQCAIHITRKDKGGWKKIGVIYPEANAIPFSRAVVCENMPPEKEEIQLMITCLKGVWDIDAVQAEWSKSVPLPFTEVTIKDAIHSNGYRVNRFLSQSDDRYAVLLSGDEVELTYEALNEEFCYALLVKGYLHEWPIETILPDPANARIALGEKVENIKWLLKHKEIFLPPLYMQWIYNNMKN